MRKTNEIPTKKSFRLFKVIKKIVGTGFCIFITVATVFLFCGGSVFGFGIRLVLSSSMQKNPDIDVSEYSIKDIPVESLIIIEFVPSEFDEAQKWYGKLRIGDVLTFVYHTVGGSATITHRIKSIERADLGYKIILAGDNAGDDPLTTQRINTADTESGNKVIGKVVYTDYFLGKTLCVMRDPIFLILVTMFILIMLFRKTVNAKSEYRLLGR